MKTLLHSELDLVSGGIDYVKAVRAVVASVNTAVNYASTAIGGYSLWDWWNSPSSSSPQPQPELTRDDNQGF